MVEVGQRPEVERGGEQVVFEAQDFQLVELAELLSRPGQVEVLEHESGDPAGLWVAGDAEPGAGARVG